MYLGIVVRTAGMRSRQPGRCLENQRERVPESQDLAIHLKEVSKNPGMSIIAKGYNIGEGTV